MQTEKLIMKRRWRQRTTPQAADWTFFPVRALRSLKSPYYTESPRYALFSFIVRRVTSKVWEITTNSNPRTTPCVENFSNPSFSPCVSFFLIARAAPVCSILSARLNCYLSVSVWRPMDNYWPNQNNNYLAGGHSVAGSLRRSRARHSAICSEIMRDKWHGWPAAARRTHPAFRAKQLSWTQITHFAEQRIILYMCVCIEKEH